VAHSNQLPHHSGGTAADFHGLPFSSAAAEPVQGQGYQSMQGRVNYNGSDDACFAQTGDVFPVQAELAEKLLGVGAQGARRLAHLCGRSR
jgi:hypothetical protein